MALKNEIEYLENRRDYNRTPDQNDELERKFNNENKEYWNTITGYFGENNSENMLLISHDEMQRLNELKVRYLIVIFPVCQDSYLQMPKPPLMLKCQYQFNNIPFTYSYPFRMI